MKKRITKVLRPYQREGFRMLKRNGIGGFLNWEMRLGKTLVIVRYVEANIPNGRILVMAPFSAFQGWLDDFAEEGIVPVVVRGTAEQKNALLSQDKGWFLINKEGFYNRVKTPHLKKKTKDIPLPAICEPWDAVVLDESHFVKSPKATVTKFVLDVFENTPVKICLSGTPMEHSELDFVTQFKFLLGRHCPFRDYWQFKALYTRQAGFTTYLTRNGKKVLSDIGSVLMSSLTRKQAGIEKEKVFQTHLVELPPKARKIYNKLFKDWVLEYNKTNMVTKYVLQQRGYMQRILGGFLPPEEKGGKSVFLHDAKIKALLDLLADNFKHEPVLIWATYTDEIELIEQAFTKKKIKFKTIRGSVPLDERHNIEKEFKAGKFDRLILQPETVKQGKDFSRASVSIYYSLPRSNITWRQSQDRILNLLKDDSLLIITLLIEDSIEEEQRKSLDKKLTKEQEIIRMIQNGGKK